MAVNFNEVIDRKPTHSFKWDKYTGQDVIPVWVADAEFKPPQQVIDAIKGIFIELAPDEEEKQFFKQMEQRFQANRT